MENHFKVGDKVYCPKVGTDVYTLEYNTHNTYTLTIDEKGVWISFTEGGHEYRDDLVPCIFHAIEENRELLGKLYGIDFAKPVKVKPAKQIIEEMLADGWANVPCYLSDQFKNPTNKNCIDFVVGTRHGQYVTSNGVTWYYAVPIDPKSGKCIIDYVDGNVITE